MPLLCCCGMFTPDRFSQGRLALGEEPEEKMLSRHPDTSPQGGSESVFQLQGDHTLPPLGTFMPAWRQTGIQEEQYGFCSSHVKHYQVAHL